MQNFFQLFLYNFQIISPFTNIEDIEGFFLLFKA